MKQSNRTRGVIGREKRNSRRKRTIKREREGKYNIKRSRGRRERRGRGFRKHQHETALSECSGRPLS